MSKLLAPNGKPSNLTPEQYKLVRTPAFKKWFGDWENSPETASKVVDENGEPLVCYHGSNKKFYEFKHKAINDYGFLGVGYYFTNLKNWAEAYSKVYQNDSGEPTIYSVFLNIRKPYQMTKYDSVSKDSAVEWTEHLKSILKDGVLWQGEVDDEIALKRNYREYVAFYPTQIKLADGTNTTFDANNPDIRYAKGGIIKKYKNGGLIEPNENYKEIAEELYNKIDFKLDKTQLLKYKKHTLKRLFSKRDGVSYIIDGERDDYFSFSYLDKKERIELLSDKLKEIDEEKKERAGKKYFSNNDLIDFVRKILIDNNIDFKENSAINTGSHYFKTAKGVIRISDHTGKYREYLDVVIFLWSKQYYNVEELKENILSIFNNNPDIRYAKGGNVGKRVLSALNRDKKYTSEQEWEKSYSKNRKSKVLKYSYNTKTQTENIIPKKRWEYTIGGL